MRELTVSGARYDFTVDSPKLFHSFTECNDFCGTNKCAGNKQNQAALSVSTIQICQVIFVDFINRYFFILFYFIPQAHVYNEMNNTILK